MYKNCSAQPKHAMHHLQALGQNKLSLNYLQIKNALPKIYQTNRIQTNYGPKVHIICLVTREQSQSAISSSYKLLTEDQYNFPLILTSFQSSEMYPQPHDTERDRDRV